MPNATKTKIDYFVIRIISQSLYSDAIHVSKYDSENVYSRSEERSWDRSRDQSQARFPERSWECSGDRSLNRSREDQAPWTFSNVF